MSVIKSGPIAYLTKSESAVFFSKLTEKAGTVSKSAGTYAPLRKLQNELNIAYWGEDNRFPNNIEQQMAYCGIGKAGLDWKARALYGNGIVPGKITGVKDDGSEIFTPLPRNTNKAIYKFLDNRLLYRFWVEYLQDWVWFNNCFPEMILSKDGQEITGFVHQESCDSRFQQMDDSGRMNKVFLSKLWGASKDQFASFDPTKAMRGLLQNNPNPDLIDISFIKKMDCIDMYDPAGSLKEIADRQLASGGLNSYKSAIFPTNYPSPNKTYYQVPAWDGARLAGWVEIAVKIPTLLKALYNKAFRIRYHIEVPDSYFEDKYTPEVWSKKNAEERAQAHSDLLDDMDEALAGGDNAYKSFVTFYKTFPQTKTDYDHIKITEVPDTSKLDKEFVTQSAADIQLLVAMQIDPTLFGAGTIGTGQQRSGGSDKREGYNIYTSGLNLERQIAMEPLYLARDYNQWGDDIVYRVRDTVMQTLDKGAGQKPTTN